MPNVLKTLRISEGDRSEIWDYRNETRPNGGPIALRACVHHIPVIPQKEGRADLDLLRNILLGRGLMVQFGTDGEGNVALYTRPDRLCYHAKGGNSQTCGIEHMHWAVGDPWSKKQHRAAGWIANYLNRDFGLPLRMADIEPGSGATITVARTGHTSHEQVSAQAGYHDRSDPGSGFDYDYVFHCARYFAQKGHFEGA